VEAAARLVSGGGRRCWVRLKMAERLTEGDLYQICLDLRREKNWCLAWTRGYMGLDFNEDGAEEANYLLLEKINQFIADREARRG
jgi:hypothetical protein